MRRFTDLISPIAYGPSQMSALPLSFGIHAIGAGLLLCFVLTGCNSSSKESPKATSDPRIEIGGFPEGTEVFDLSAQDGSVTVVNLGSGECILTAVFVEYQVEEGYYLSGDNTWLDVWMRGFTRVFPSEGIRLAPLDRLPVASIETSRLQPYYRSYYESGIIVITVHFRDADGFERTVVRSVAYIYASIVVSG